MDFTDHILQRLLPCIEKQLWQEHLEELKLRIETVLALAVTEYTFSYLNPSLLTGSAVKLVLSRFQLTCHDFIEEPSIDFKLCQSICTHSVRTNFWISRQILWRFFFHFRNKLRFARDNWTKSSINWKRSCPITYWDLLSMTSQQANQIRIQTTLHPLLHPPLITIYPLKWTILAFWSADTIVCNLSFWLQ